ncbi:hypothetical protein BDB00DRAFT_465656 [Zychaea mexicana]|uniref:uncharacterized protein n=1 Tax=Zychaea mexicana TaxID=64656 RepID=UPI0022FED82E|nr:uncharacterized protein BDB00DRAFT_465656 [Zychaea mexicana]KAI9492007.1 hypothetical protein BDB00DRAFT_465656 [Zychaea mexicana]
MKDTFTTTTTTSTNNSSMAIPAHTFASSDLISQSSLVPSCDYKNEWDQIDAWLHDLYPVSMPSFEKDEYTLHNLQQLHKKTEEASNIMEMVLNTQRQLSDDNARQAALWQEKLDALEVSRSSMSTQGTRALDALGLLAVRLGLDDTSLSSYHTALAQLTMETMDTRLEEKEIEETEYVLQSRIRNAEGELDKMKGILSSVKQRRQSNSHENDQALAMQQQNKESKNAYARMQNEFDSLEIDQHELRLESIKTLEHDMASLEAILAEKSGMVDSYGNLPSDMVLASLKVQDAQVQLNSLGREREQLLADMADNMH